MDSLMMLMIVIGIIFVLYLTGLVEFNNKSEKIPHKKVAENNQDSAKESLDASSEDHKSMYYHALNGSGSTFNEKFAYDHGTSKSPYTKTHHYRTTPTTVEIDPHPTLGRQGGAYSMGKTAFVQQGKDMTKDITTELDPSSFLRAADIVPEPEFQLTFKDSYI